MLCQCCEEREAHEKCGGLCVECSRPTHCSHCEKELDDGDINEWEPDNQVDVVCANCVKDDATVTWLDDTCAAVERLADEHDWDASDWQRAQTGSRYIELSRECDACILGKDDECTCEMIVVRVSDHGSAYCREDFSLAKHASGDDHTIAQLASRLARRN